MPSKTKTISKNPRAIISAQEKKSIADALALAKKKVPEYLEGALRAGKIDAQLFKSASTKTLANLEGWLKDPDIDWISPNAKKGIVAAITDGRWVDIVNAFRQELRFGTGGIRGMMAFDWDSIVKLHEQGLDAPILKGPNTMNNLVVLLKSAGVAKFGKAPKRGFSKIVIGYDSRVRGQDLAKVVAQLFLAKGYTVYFFDAPCSYPEVTFAIPYIKADMGILVSASHNDYRYNGYKLSCGNGSQFDPKERTEMYNQYIEKASFADVALCTFAEAKSKSIYFLGGDKPLATFDYAGKEANIIDIHKEHRNHVKSFLMTKDLPEQQAAASNPLQIGFCAFHGAGAFSVPRLLEEVGFSHIYKITKNDLNEPNGLFPSFCHDAGREQQPDPGDHRSATIAVNAFKEEYPEKFSDIDVLIGTDPDADRCGVIVQVPPDQRFLYGDREWTLLPADDLWALVIWYRLMREAQANGGKVPAADKKFLVLSITTSDSITLLAKKYGIGVIRTWVGFASLSAAVNEIWNGNFEKYSKLVDGRNAVTDELCNAIICDTIDMTKKRSFNIGAMEQSNGFSILGGIPKDNSSLGAKGHVRDKDGTFAALLTAEIAAWAKSLPQPKDLFSLIDEYIYLDPAIGLFVTGYEPDPLDGEYPGIEGDRQKKAILRRTMGLFQMALAGDLSIGGLPVKSATLFRTGKYDAIYPKTFDFEFVDEGIRFYFDDEKRSHCTVRPSGTGNSLRFHTQLHTFIDGTDPVQRKANLIIKKRELRERTNLMLDDIRKLLKAPRS